MVRYRLRLSDDKKNYESTVHIDSEVLPRVGDTIRGNGIVGSRGDYDYVVSEVMFADFKKKGLAKLLLFTPGEIIVEAERKK